MPFLSAHISLFFAATCSIISLIGMSAITVTGFHYLRAMEASRNRIRIEQQSARRTPPLY